MMKLISCYVENFGTLHDYKLDFSDGLTVVKQDNGFGKTTLAAFIKAMFYGLPQSTKRSISENERKKYTPWQGGNFGGSLIFSVDDIKKYEIQRFFAAKEKDDTFKIFDISTGLLSTDYTHNIGFELFGIDAEGFERSIYLPQHEVTMEMNTSLSAKLSNLVENSDDINNFDSAMEKIKKRRSYYTVQNGTRGAVADAKNDILELEQKIVDCKAAMDDLDKIRIEQGQTEQKIVDSKILLDEIRKKITNVSSADAARAAEQRRGELIEQLDKLKAILSTLKSRYPNGVPQKSDLEKISNLLKQLSNIQNKKAFISENVDKAQFNELSDFFSIGVPNENEIIVLRENLRKAEENDAVAETLLQQMSILPSQKASGKKTKWLLILSGLFFVLGFISAVFSTATMIALLLLGVILLGVSGFIYLKNMISLSSPKNNTVELKAKADRLKLNAEELKADAERFVKQYCEADNIFKQLDYITQQLRDYKRLEKLIFKAEQEVAECEALIDNFMAEILSFFSNYGVGLDGEYEEKIVVVSQDIERMPELEKEISSLNASLNQLPTVSALSIIESEESIEVLKHKENELVQSINRENERLLWLKNRVDYLENSAEQLSELKSLVETRRQDYVEHSENLEVLDITAKLLEKAKLNLSEKYLGVISESFGKYSNLIFGADIGNYLIGADLNVNIDRLGGAKTKDYFSTGYKNMIDIATRLSLIDALYGEQKPMLILDDPFVNMDDDRVKNSLSLLEELSRKHQIVYLTCHSSRC